MLGVKLEGSSGGMEMLQRLFANWVYGGALSGVLLLALAPILVGVWPDVLALTFLHLPVYMLHQYEEHDHDRFRVFVNQKMAGGREALSRADVFVINVPGVWGVIAVALYLAWFVNLGFALIAVYLVLVNALVHIAHLLIYRAYNPGVVSAILLFLPLGAFSWWKVAQAGAGGGMYQAVGLITAVAIHAAIMAYVVRGGKPAPSTG